MTSAEYYDEDNYIFPQITDPDIDIGIAAARNLQYQLDMHPEYTPAQRRRLLEKLNQGWSLLGDEVELSGRVEMGIVTYSESSTGELELHEPYMVVTENDPEPEPVPQSYTVFADDLALVSLGFKLVNSGPYLIGDEQIANDRFAVVHDLRFKPDIELAIDEDESLPLLIPCSAQIDDVHLKAPRAKSALTDRIMYEYFPDFMQDINTHVMTKSSLADAIMGLQSVSTKFDLTHVTYKDMALLGDYTDSLIDCSRDPEAHTMRLKKGALLYSRNPETGLPALVGEWDSEDAALVKLDSIDIGPWIHITRDENNTVTGVALELCSQFVPRLLFRNIEPQTGYSLQLIVDIEDVSYLKGVRETFYQDDE